MWSIATIVSASANFFWQLLIYRILLGVGQSVVGPTVLSIISDLFTSDRSLFISFFTSMIYSGQVFGLGCGALSQATSWRIAFLTLGFPGLFLAIPLILTIREPVRGLREKIEEKDLDKSVLNDVNGEGTAINQSVTALSEDSRLIEQKTSEQSETCLKILQRSWWIYSYPPFLLLWFSAMMRYVAGYAIGGWIQVFYRRVHNISPSKLSLFLAIIIPTAGAPSAYLGGWIADVWEKRVVGGKAWLCAVSSFFGCIAMAVVLLLPSASLSLTALWFEYLFAELWYAPAASIALDLNPPFIRSFATAIYLGCGCFGAGSSALVGWLNVVFGVTIPSEENETDEVSGKF